MEKLEKVFLRAEALLLLMATLGAVVFHLRQPFLLPSDDDFQKAAEFLQAEAQPLDMVLLHPWWLEGFRRSAPREVPVMGYQGSEAALFTSHPRIWILSAAPLPFTRELPLEAESPLSEPRRWGPLTLMLYKNPHFRPQLFSAFEHLSRATVAVEKPDKTVEPCTQMQPGHFTCPLGATVRAEWHEVHFAPEKCVYVQPPRQNARLLISFSDIPQGMVALKAGYIWDRGEFTETSLSPVDIQMPGFALTLPAQYIGFLTASAPTRDSNTTLSVSAPNPQLREVCLQFFVSEEAGIKP